MLITAIFTTISFEMAVDLTKLAFEHSFRLIARYTLLLGKLLNVLFSCSFGGICNRLFFNDCYSFLCPLPLDGLVLDELSFGEVYDLWPLLRLFFGSREDRWQLVRSLGAIEC